MKVASCREQKHRQGGAEADKFWLQKRSEGEYQLRGLQACAKSLHGVDMSAGTFIFPSGGMKDFEPGFQTAASNQRPARASAPTLARVFCPGCMHVNIHFLLSVPSSKETF